MLTYWIQKQLVASLLFVTLQYIKNIIYTALRKHIYKKITVSGVQGLGDYIENYIDFTLLTQM